jgi:hypothetical protein
MKMQFMGMKTNLQQSTIATKQHWTKQQKNTSKTSKATTKINKDHNQNASNQLAQQENYCRCYNQQNWYGDVVDNA